MKKVDKFELFLTRQCHLYWIQVAKLGIYH